MVHADQAPKLWPDKPFEHVVAYCYDYTQDERGASITFPDGSLHAGVIRSTTLRLDAKQVLKLRTLLSKDTGEEEAEVDCYDPHHAFVFYDATWKVIASVDICFLCENYSARPKGVAEVVDFEALEDFCRRIGLPVFGGAAGYSALFKQEQPSAPAPKRQPARDPFPGEVDPFAPTE